MVSTMIFEMIRLAKNIGTRHTDKQWKIVGGGGGGEWLG